MYQGRCLCGQVEITVTGPISSIIHCHCSKCRKNSGTAYATNGFVARSDFSLVRGADKLTRFATAEGKHRFFCRTCGSPVYSENLQDPDRLRLRLGILDRQLASGLRLTTLCSQKRTGMTPMRNYLATMVWSLGGL